MAWWWTDRVRPVTLNRLFFSSLSVYTIDNRRIRERFNRFSEEFNFVCATHAVQHSTIVDKNVGNLVYSVRVCVRVQERGVTVPSLPDLLLLLLCLSLSFMKETKLDAALTTANSSSFTLTLTRRRCILSQTQSLCTYSATFILIVSATIIVSISAASDQENVCSRRRDEIKKTINKYKNICTLRFVLVVSFDFYDVVLNDS